MKSIVHLCRLTYDYCIPRLRTSGSEIGWDMGFEIGFSVGMVMVESVGSPLGHSNIMLRGSALDISFGTREGYLSRVLVTHDSFSFKMCKVSIESNLELHMRSHIRELLASDIFCWGYIWRSQVKLKSSLDCM